MWAANLGCIDLNPWPVRRADVDHPDELRVDLDPQPGVPYSEVQAVAGVIHEVLEEHDLVGYPKTSGSRGIHVNVRIEPRWDFTEMRRAALALGREVERRMPGRATTKWWKEERGEDTVFIDYNQNARDRTVASAYSVRAERRGSGQLPARRGTRSWKPTRATSRSRRFRLATRPSATRPPRSTTCAFSLQPLLDLAARDERDGLGDEAWPPNFPKAAGEPKRVAPSRAKKPPAKKPKSDGDVEAEAHGAAGRTRACCCSRQKGRSRTWRSSWPASRSAGSWWSHPASHEIFAVLNELADSPDVVRQRLGQRQGPLVHRRLAGAGPAASIASRPNVAAIEDEHAESGAHRKTEIAVPRLGAAQTSMRRWQRVCRHADALGMLPDC